MLTKILREQRAMAKSSQPPKGIPDGVEQIIDMNFDPRFKGLLSRKQIMADAQVQSDEIAKQNKKRKIIIGVAIGVGVLSIVGLIIYLRKK
jgi:hypothetical protein